MVFWSYNCFAMSFILERIERDIDRLISVRSTNRRKLRSTFLKREEYFLGLFVSMPGVEKKATSEVHWKYLGSWCVLLRGW